MANLSHEDECTGKMIADKARQSKSSSVKEKQNLVSQTNYAIAIIMYNMSV